MRRQYKLDVRGGVITVTSPFSGRSFRVSARDRALVDGVPWTVCWKDGKLQVINWRVDGQTRYLSLGRLITGAKRGQQVLFKNGDSTDLRRGNLVLRDNGGFMRKPPVIRIAGDTVHVTNPYHLRRKAPPFRVGI